MSTSPVDHIAFKSDRLVVVLGVLNTYDKQFGEENNTNFQLQENRFIFEQA